MSLSKNDPAREPKTPLQACEAVFTGWLTDKYDVYVLRASLAAAAVLKLDGDPAWLLVVGSPGAGKTETVGSLGWVDQSGPINLLEGPLRGHALVRSSLSGEAALLSGTKNQERAKDATGGLLREIGNSGVLVLKDVTTILGMNRDRRAEILAALREVYDGHWTRSIGTDGGKTLEWRGRIVVIGAVTEKWDDSHAVVASMGDRFLLVRVPSDPDTLDAIADKAMENTGSEGEMRRGLGQAVAAVLDGVSPAMGSVLKPLKAERDVIRKAAMLTTWIRTYVDKDYQGNVVSAHSPEAPTRFTKQLVQMFRGALAIGMSPADALRLTVRIARDSVPPLRLAVLEHVAKQPGTNTTDTAKGLDMPRQTVDRCLQELHQLRILKQSQVLDAKRWSYRVTDKVDVSALDVDAVVDKATSEQGSARWTELFTRYVPPRDRGNMKEGLSLRFETQTSNSGNNLPNRGVDKSGDLPPHLHLFHHFAIWAGQDWFDVDYATEGATFTDGVSARQLGRDLFDWATELGLIELNAQRPSVARLSTDGRMAAQKVADLIGAEAKRLAKPAIIHLIRAAHSDGLKAAVDAVESARLALETASLALRVNPNSTKLKGAWNRANAVYEQRDSELNALCARRDAAAEAEWEQMDPPTWSVA